MYMKFDVSQKIAIYARHSHSQSALDDQVRNLMDLVEQAGSYVEYDCVYADKCHVGPEQVALKQLLQDVDAKGIKAVVVKDPSRISRNVNEIVEVASIFVEQGAKLYFVYDKEIVDLSELSK